VALDGLENILKVGDLEKVDSLNQFAVYVEEAGGMEKIHNLQTHDNIDIYKKAYHIIDKYFAEDDEEDSNLAPEMDMNTGQFIFQPDLNLPQGGFNFDNNTNQPM
ncbi:22279_t:CDS:1, partial [Entrophospora sp. SA101]